MNTNRIKKRNPKEWKKEQIRTEKALVNVRAHATELGTVYVGTILAYIEYLLVRYSQNIENNANQKINLNKREMK